MKNFGKSIRGQIFRAPIYGAHCAVIFALAQLSCFKTITLLGAQDCYAAVSGPAVEPAIVGMRVAYNAVPLRQDVIMYTVYCGRSQV